MKQWNFKIGAKVLCECPSNRGHSLLFHVSMCSLNGGLSNFKSTITNIYLSVTFSDGVFL